MRIGSRFTRFSSRRSRAVAASTAAIALTALGAAGCGGGSSGGGGETGIVGDGGALEWLPADTWLVATGNLDAEAIDTAVQSLDRLPIWALAEGFLPARDGKGLRRELLEEIAKQSAEKGAKPKVTATELETAFGDRVGFAITSTDFEAIDGEEPPFVGWVDVDDEDAAVAAAKDLLSGTEKEREHEGVTYFESPKDELTFLVRDGLLVVSSTPKQIERLIEVRDGDSDDSLAGDDVAAAVIEVGVGDSLAGFAIASEPLLAAAPDIVRDSAGKANDEGVADAEQAKRAEEIADELGPVLESNAVDEMIPDWIAGSATIDETGLRLRGSWSNPRELADPDVGSRELVERMPADVPIATGMVSDGSTLGRVQGAWSEVRDAYDLDLRALVARECPTEDRWACDLGIELALWMLEDEALADQAADAGDSTMVMTQDLSPLLASLAGLASGGDSGAIKPVTARLFEIATTAEQVKVAPSKELVAAATKAGIEVSQSDDGLSMTFRVLAGSPLARTLAAELDTEARQALAAIGFDVRQLLSPAGMTITAEQVDDITVAGFPPAAPSKVVPALKGDTDVLGEAQTYRDVVAAAKPPKQVGVYGFVDLKTLIEGMFTTLGAAQPDVQRIIPTVRNNLADVPGIVSWSTREEHDGEPVGVIEMSMPILE